MNDWQTETSIYIPRLEGILSRLDLRPPFPENIPSGPFDTPPSLLQSIAYNSAVFYGLNWRRTRETMEAIIVLWGEGYISSAAVLVRPIFELWGTTHYMTDELQAFSKHKDAMGLSQVVLRLCAGVRSEVLLPWGTPATEKPIHVLDTIRLLSQASPDAMAVYEALCESSHANQPRYQEWWLLGKNGDNWTNPTVQTRGHALITKTIDAMERAAIGVKIEAEIGMKFCGELY